MKKLSETDNGDYVMYETYNGREEYVPKEDIYYFLKEEGENVKAVYSTERKAVKINKYHLDDFLEMFENQVHEEWAEEMFNDLADSPEWLAFVEKFNQTAENNPTYFQDERLIID